MVFTCETNKVRRRSSLVLIGALFSNNSRFSCDVTAAMLMYRTIMKKVFWDFHSFIMQNESDILPLFCTPTRPSHHVSENQELLISGCYCFYYQYYIYLFIFLRTRMVPRVSSTIFLIDKRIV